MSGSRRESAPGAGGGFQKMTQGENRQSSTSPLGINGIRAKPPEFGVTRTDKPFGRTVISCDFKGLVRLVHIFTMDDQSIAALKKFERGDTLRASGNLVEEKWTTPDGRVEKIIKLPFATGLSVIRKRSRP